MNKEENRKISSIAVSLNQMCNLNCVYCYRHVKAAAAMEMGDGVLEQTIKFIQETKPGQISFAQREPTMSFIKLKYMVETLGDGYKYHITTNGYALTKEMVEFFKTHNFGVLISYDSVMQGFRPTVTGSDSNPIVRSACRMLIEGGINPTCLMLVTEQSLPRIEEMLEDVIEIGFKGAFLNRDTQLKSPTCVRDVGLFEEKMRAAKKIGEERRISLGPFFRINQKADNKFKKSLPNHFTCGAGKGGIAVHPDGVLYPCHHTNAWAELKMSIGSVFEGIDWEKKAWFEQAGPGGEQMKKCHACGSVLCGSCYLDNRENTGNMLTPAKEGCEILMALYRAAGVPQCSNLLTGQLITAHPNGEYDLRLPTGEVIRVAITPRGQREGVRATA